MSTDVFTPEQRSAVMRRVKGRDTAPELAVRRILRAAGVGYRLGGAGLPGRPDLVMKGRRVALFVHGCFWHGHDCARGGRKPKANAAYWTAKIDRNRARDEASRAALTAAGWRVVTVWECAMKAGDFAGRLTAEVKDQAAAVSAAGAMSD
jgi:DNA mismatch endonuclease (patch repair protein)